MTFPNSLDTFFSDLVDLVVLHVDSVSGNTFTIAVADRPLISSLSIGAKLVFSYTGAALPEVVLVASKDTTSVTCTRAQEGTTQLTTGASMILVHELTEGIWSSLRDAVLRTQKYAGLVAGSLPASPLPGQMCLIGSDVYVCFQSGVWDKINNTNHSLLTGLSDDAAHADYYTASAFSTWHTALPGDHLTNPTTHDHSGAAGMGNAVERFRNGLYSARPAAANIGDVFYATDTKVLYISTDGTTWTPYTSMPRGSVVMFDSAECPVGWERVVSLDGKLLRGAPTNTWTGLVGGGAETHTHVMPTLLAHTHTINSQSVTTNTTGSHNHGFYIYTSAGANDAPFEASGGSSSSLSTGSGGYHEHTATKPSQNAQPYGSGSAPETAAQSSLPPYTNILFCRKV